MDELDPDETSTRRGLLGALARNAARRAREGAEIAGPAGLGLEAAGAGLGPGPAAPAPAAPAVPARHRARVPARVVTVDELLELAHADGLTRRDGALRALAWRSLRMIPIETGDAEAWIGTREDRIAAGEEVLLAVISLAATSALESELGGEGWLVVFVESGDVADFGARRAHGVLLDMPAPISEGAVPVALHAELVMPRRWHEAVQELDLDDDEGDAYERLRMRLQNLQGVESDADGGTTIAYHRLLGYPNETTGSMPADCAGAAQEWSAAEGPGSGDAEPATASGPWRLLAQISVGERRRAYVWIRQADLEAREFGHMCAFLR